MALLPIPNNSFLTFKPYIIPIYVPFMIGTGVLQQLGLSIDFSTQHLTPKPQHWHLPLQFRHGRAYILHEKIPFSKCYTKPELLKMHKHSMHSLPGKRFHLIKHAKPEKAGPKIFKILQQISAAFESCAPYTVPPFRFRTTITPDEAIFNRDLAMYLMYLHKNQHSTT